MPLKLFTDESLLRSGMPHVPMLVPFLGRIDPEESPEYHRFDRYAAIAGSLYATTSLADADVAVLPFGWEAVLATPTLGDVAARFADRVRRAGKRLIVFCESDSAAPIPIEGALVYRTSLYRSTHASNEFALPGWTGDLADFRTTAALPPIRGERPIAGFLGRVPERSRSVSRNILIGLRQAAGRATGEPPSFRVREAHARTRARAVSILESAPRIDARIVREPRFAGGSGRPDGSIDWAALTAALKRFVAHADSCEYLLCVRGAGNFSYRFYEALCLGKIPLFVDSDCVLPFEDVVPWRSRMPWVDGSSLETLPAALSAFDSELDAGGRMALHTDMRAMWERWLSPEGFFTTLASTLP